jgi:NADH-quinone oxidoreductase subunit E
MPELTVTHIGLLAVMLAIGVLIGWMIRTDRCAKEKIAVNASWQDQLESQQSEHGRLAEQNKSLMEQISQYQASQKDYANRAKELSGSLKDAFARRDDLQRQLKDMRGKLELAVVQRNQARQELQRNPQGQDAAMKEKDDKIFKLSRELTSWQSRVPPLVERFQERNKEALALQEELDKAHTRLQALEELVKSDNTRIEPVDADSLPDGGDASNEPIAMTSAHDTAEIQDQIDDHEDPDEHVEPIDPGDVEPVADDEDFDDIFAYEKDTGDEDDELTDDAPDGDVQKFHAVFSGNGSQAPDDPEPGTDAIDDDAEDRDDLKKIKGIGPSIEKTLNELGVFRFHQIAEMSEYEIDRVAQQLKGFRSRIYREDWIGQARDLQYQKNSDPS